MEVLTQTSEANELTREGGADEPTSAQRLGRTPSAHDVLIITPPRGWQLLNLIDLWRYRDLIRSMVTRELMGRYRQTLLGTFWSPLQPIIFALIFTFCFTGKFPTKLPYPLFVLSGMVPWNLFARVISESSNSLLGGQNLIKKVYFPRLILLIAPTITAVVDLLISFVIISALLIWYRIWPGWPLLAAPLLILIMMLTALSVAVWTTALGVVYRDVRQLLPFIIQAWFFLSPIFYPPSVLSGRSHLLFNLNPMVGVLQGFRWSLCGDAPPSVLPMLISGSVVAVLLISGLYYFRRVECSVADYL
jgi:lipopolysaccharide transport system permease protein